MIIESGKKKIMKRKLKSFSMAELLIALLAVSVIVSATIPTFTRKASTNEQVFRFVTTGAGGGNSGYTCPNDSCSIVIGNNRVVNPGDVNNSNVFNTNIQNKNLNLVKNYVGGANNSIRSGISSNSHLTFYNKNTSEINDIKGGIYDVGRMYFDETNLGIGLGVLGYLDVGPRPQADATTDYGRRNTAFGQMALMSFRLPDAIRRGTDNTGIGYDALSANTSNAETTQAFFVNLSPIKLDPSLDDANRTTFGRPPTSGNTSVGSFSLTHNGIGSYNTAVGRASLYRPNGGTATNANTAVGFHSMIGDGADSDCSTLDNNLSMPEGTAEPLYKAFGKGSANTALGAFSLSHNSEGYGNVAIGAMALHKNTTGKLNVALGSQTLANLTTGVYNIAIGTNAIRMSQERQYNIAIGHKSMQGTANSVAISDNFHETFGDGNYNIAIGNQALERANSSEDKHPTSNIALGNLALANYIGEDGTSSNKDYSNIALGNAALGKLEKGASNIAIGTRALLVAGSGTDNKFLNDNIAIGTQAMKGEDFDLGIPATFNYTDIHSTSGYGGANIAIGTNALFNANGTKYNRPTSNIALGNWALANFEGPADFDYGNIALGNAALGYLQSGNENIVIGTHAGKNLKSGSSNIIIGNRIDADSTTASNTLNIGNLIIGNMATGSKSITIEGDLIVKGKIKRDDDSTSTSSLTTTSSLSFYESGFNKLITSIVNNSSCTCNHTEATAGCSSSYGCSAYISKASTCTVNYNPQVDYTYMSNYSDVRLKNILSDSTAGLKEINALEIKNFTFKKDEKKTPHVGVIAQQLQKIFPNAVTKDDEGYLMIRTEDIFYAMVNSIKELYKNIQELTAKVTGLDKKITELEKQNKELIEQNKAFEERLKKLESKVE